MTLARRMEGEAVDALQRNLKKLGLYRGKPDGKYGKGTFNAVREFQRRYFVDGIANDTTIDAITSAVTAWSKTPELLTPVPDGLDEIKGRYGEFSYVEDPEEHWNTAGWVIIEDAWIEDYLVVTNFPIVGDKKVNKNIVKSLTRVLKLIADRGLDEEVKQFGCFAPRHKMHNPKRSLSVHTWAAAVDINWTDNPVGAGKGKLDPGIVSAFESLGWEWGGRWSQSSDPMHFQLCTGY